MANSQQNSVFTFERLNSSAVILGCRVLQPDGGMGKILRKSPRERRGQKSRQYFAWREARLNFGSCVAESVMKRPADAHTGFAPRARKLTKLETAI